MRCAIPGRPRPTFTPWVGRGLLPAVFAVCSLLWLPSAQAVTPPALPGAAPRGLRSVPIPAGEASAVTASAFDGQNRLTFGIGPEITKLGQERPAFTYGVTPGAQATDGAEVLNLSEVPISLSIYPSDVLNNPDGTTSFPPRGARPKDVGSWITLEIPGNTNTVTVPARAGVVIPVKFTVPLGAKPGDHVGGIVAALGSTARNSSGVLVHLDQRVATRAFFRVSGALHPLITVESLHAVYQQNYDPIGSGLLKTAFTIRNRGNVRVGVTATVEFHGLLGVHRVDTGLAAIPVLYPGGSDAMTVRFAGMIPEVLGWVTVQVQVSPVLGDTDPPLHAVSATAHVWMLPLTLILIVVALAAAWLDRGRRRKRRLTAQPDPPFPGGADPHGQPDEVGTAPTGVG